MPGGNESGLNIQESKQPGQIFNVGIFQGDKDIDYTGAMDLRGYIINLFALV